MPIYEYECIKCGKIFEVRCRLTDDEGKIKCPDCGAEHPRRVFSIFATGYSGRLSCAPTSST